jgi:hypothetical protein
MNDSIKRIDTNDLRVNLTEYLTKNLGDTIYITRYNKLVGELRVYTEEIRRKTELRIAKKMLEEAERERKGKEK